MGILNWLLSVRKKPLAERRKFVAVFTFTVTAVIALLWLTLFITVGPLQVKPNEQKTQIAVPPAFQEVLEDLR
jgi:hypothetical protein